jgi:hypothetical protein
MGDQAQQGAVSPEQWQQFMQGMQAQNAELAARLTQSEQARAQTNVAVKNFARAQMDDKQRADALQAELDQIQAFGQQAQQQQLSNDVWQRRDAEAAARVLMLNGMNGNEPGLYRQPWDVNWMPRFVASVQEVASHRNRQGSPNNNPGNRANVIANGGSSLPEIDEKLSGYETIRYALARNTISGGQ